MKKRHSPILSPGECSVLSLLLQQPDGSSATDLSRLSGGTFSREVLYVLLGRLAQSGYVRGVRQAQSVIYHATRPGIRARKTFAKTMGLQA